MKSALNSSSKVWSILNWKNLTTSYSTEDEKDLCSKWFISSHYQWFDLTFSNPEDVCNHLIFRIEDILKKIKELFDVYN